MTASIQQVEIGINRYVNEELARKKTGTSKFTIHFVAGLVAPHLTKTLISLQQVPLIGESLFDENGNVNLTALSDAARGALEKSNNRLTAFGFVFDQTDIDKLIDYITNS